MSDKIWEELLVWRLSGPRFDEHRGVDLSDLAGLVGLRIALIEVAKILWRERNNRERIPDGAEKAIDLRIKRFEDGSEQTTVWLGRPKPVASAPSQRGLFGTPVVLDDIASFAESIHDAAAVLQSALSGEGDELARLPREILRQLQLTGRGLRDDEDWTIQAVGKPQLEPAGNDGPEYSYNLPTAARTIARPEAQPFYRYFLPLDRPQAGESPVDTAQPRPPMVPASARIVPSVDAALRAKLETLVAPPKPSDLRIVQRTLSGEVTMVDVDGLAEGRRPHGRVRIRPEGHVGEPVEIEFLPQDEELVTSALYRHNNKVRLRVRGDAHLDERGRLRRFEARIVVEVKAPNPNAMGEEYFERLVEEDPSRLLELLQPGVLDPTLLTFAAEIAGRGLPTSLVVGPLLELLRHDRSIVREGALYGLRGHRGLEVTTEIRRLAETDSSPGVRRAAEGVLKSR